MPEPLPYYGNVVHNMVLAVSVVRWFVCLPAVHADNGQVRGAVVSARPVTSI